MEVYQPDSVGCASPRPGFIALATLAGARACIQAGPSDYGPSHYGPDDAGNGDASNGDTG